MDEDNSKQANRRTVVKTVAGVGVAGLGAQPALAGDGDDVEKDEEYPMGPLADAPDSEKLSYREFERLLSTEENGSAELVSGRATEVRTYVGDDRSVDAFEAQDRFETGTMATKPTWKLGCVDVPFVGEVCSEITLDISTSGIVFDLVIFGYPVVGAGVKFNDGDVSFKFNVPKIPVKGELTVGASSFGACDVSVTAELSLNVVPYTLGGSKTFNYC